MNIYCIKCLKFTNYNNNIKIKCDTKKSHTCEEGEAHLRISFSHLLMNLKNKKLLKKTFEVGQ